MRYVLSKTFDPYFNLATEEYLLKNTTDDVFMLWRSEPCVVVGKHQNALSEINYRYVLENKLKIARRLSGGGTVVHDLENLNFTFIANGEEGKLIDFKKFVSPIVKYINSLGIESHIGKKNDILVGSFKISGNAEHIFKKRVLHHGTLLFDSDLKRLKNAIQAVPGKYIDKAVQSNRATVANISSFLTEKITIDEFIGDLSNNLLREMPNTSISPLTDSETNSIRKLSEEKYKRQEWILGYSPKYEFKQSFTYKHDRWNIRLFIEKGQIKDAYVQMNDRELTTLENLLIGQYHTIDSLRMILSGELRNLSAPDLYTLSFHFF
jgi:lipoate---protein ligase